MNLKNRPLSPHLQIYKPQISSFTSILHRATGIFLYFGVIIFCWTIFYYAYQLEISPQGLEQGESCHCYWRYFLYSALLAWAFSIYYHLCNGIRHLFWDIGKGFDKKTANYNGILVLVISLTTTIISFLYVYNS